MAEKKNPLMTQLRVNNFTKRALSEAFNSKPNQVQIGHNYKENKLEISVVNLKLNPEQEKVLRKAEDFLQSALAIIS